MKAVGDFQRAHAKYLMRGRFADDEGIACRTGGYPCNPPDTTGFSRVLNRQTPGVLVRR